MATNSNPLKYATRDGVCYITLDRPPANAYNLRFMQRFAQLLERAERDIEVGTIVINSASQKFFCAGADIKEFGQNDTADNQKLVSKAREVAALLENSKHITIAQLAGHTLGGGLEIALACDFRFAAKANYSLGLPEIKLGLIPGNGGTQRLLRLAGMGRALELLVSGDSIGIQQAFDWGLVNQLYPASDLHDQTFAFAKQLANGPSLAITAIKKAIYQGADLSMAAGIQLEKQLCDELYNTDDATEGFAAFLQKRTAKFTDK